MRKVVLVLSLLAGCLARTAAAEAEKDVLLRLSFDGPPRSQGAAAVAEPVVQDSVEYVAGVKGRALAAGRGGLRYAIPEGILTGPRGTISLWVKPLDWDAESYIDFLQVYRIARAWTPLFRLYRVGGSPHQGILALKYRVPPPNVAVNFHRKRVDGWKKKDGDWHHIAFAWEGTAGVLFVDGLETGRDPEIAGSLKDGNTLIAGGASMMYPPSGPGVRSARTTAIDEVTVHGRALGPDEVKKAFEAVRGPLESLDAF